MYDMTAKEICLLLEGLCKINYFDKTLMHMIQVRLSVLLPQANSTDFAHALHSLYRLDKLDPKLLLECCNITHTHLHKCSQKEFAYITHVFTKISRQLKHERTYARAPTSRSSVTHEDILSNTKISICVENVLCGMSKAVFLNRSQTLPDKNIVSLLHAMAICTHTHTSCDILAHIFLPEVYVGKTSKLFESIVFIERLKSDEIALLLHALSHFAEKQDWVYKINTHEHIYLNEKICSSIEGCIPYMTRANISSVIKSLRRLELLNINIHPKLFQNLRLALHDKAQTLTNCSLL